MYGEVSTSEKCDSLLLLNEDLVQVFSCYVVLVLYSVLRGIEISS